MTNSGFLQCCVFRFISGEYIIQIWLRVLRSHVSYIDSIDNMHVCYFSRVEHESIFLRATAQRGLSPSQDQRTPSSRLLP